MHVLITGAAGFLGRRVAQALLDRGALAGRLLASLHLADRAAPPPALVGDPRVRVATGELDALCAAWARGGEGAPRFDAVFHLAAAVSGECEDDLDLGLRANLDATRALLAALRAQAEGGGPVARLVFASSLAVYGPDGDRTLPDVVDDDALATPQTSYGTQKLACEHLVADFTRRGLLDGRSARMMTVAVRAGRPNGAASGFFSGVIREPLAGVRVTCPVDPSVASPIASPARTVEGLIAVCEADAAALGGRRGLNLPALNVRVQDLLDGLEAVAGPRVRARVELRHDPAIARIVAGWPRAAAARRATALGLAPDASAEALIRDYIAEREAAGDAAALAGLDA